MVQLYTVKAAASQECLSTISSAHTQQQGKNRISSIVSRPLFYESISLACSLKRLWGLYSWGGYHTERDVEDCRNLLLLFVYPHPVCVKVCHVFFFSSPIVEGKKLLLENSIPNRFSWRIAPCKNRRSVS